METCREIPIVWNNIRLYPATLLLLVRIRVLYERYGTHGL